MTKHFLWAILAAALLVTSGCESSEERAEKHFQDGVALLEAGDVDRALVEFRNVFRLNGTHKEARRRYAEAEIDRGNIQAGYSQYLRLVEQYPDDEDARRELTRLALLSGNWDEVAKHSPRVIEADASDPIGRLAAIGLRYRQALEAEDSAAQAEVAKEALELRDELPDNPIVPELLADYYIREGRREEALDELARAIELSDDPRRVYGMRLGLLHEMGDLDAVETGLVEMVDRFPDDAEVQASLVRWYLSQGKIDEAEAFLRTRAEAGTSSERIDLVRFLVQYRDRDAAIAELDTLREQHPDEATVYKSVRAGLVFEAGQREEAIAELQSIVDSAEEQTADILNVKVALAQMLVQTGNSVGARALVEDVLAADASHVAALKMRAAWLIEGDEADQAIQTLRTALEQSPRDPSLMTLMAQAYERSGNRALMAEMLSLAVEVSNHAPEETLRYVRYLQSEDKGDIAESTLIDSLRLNPGSLPLLETLGGIYAQRGDWPRAEQVAGTLAGLEGPEAEGAANTLRAQVLAGQGRNEDVLALLEGLVESGEGGFGANLAIVRTHLASGDTDKAMAYVDEQLSAKPDDATLLFLKGAVLEAQSRPAEAEPIYQALTAETPKAILVWRALYLLQMRDGRTDDAAATLDQALAANPADADLLWMKASQLQSAGDLEGALAVYEGMYEQNSSAPIIANNYASLLSSLRNDDESLAKAYAVARRLQGIEVPAFQDTFGWIAYRRGEYAVAVESLEPAAAALAEDPSVHYHLALAYDATGRKDDAKTALTRAVDLADAGKPFPELDEARQKLAELDGSGGD